jgi:hypothetical protein
MRQTEPMRIFEWRSSMKTGNRTARRG